MLLSMKKLFLIVAICMIYANTFSQRIQHGVGFGVLGDHVKDVDLNGSFDVIYSPKINLTETSLMSVSIGIPLSISFCEAQSAESDPGITVLPLESSKLRIMVHVPLMLNLNFGAGSSEKSSKRFGGFIGGGYAYCNYTKTNLLLYDKEGNQYTRALGGSTTGPAANGGICFRVHKHHVRDLVLRLNYYKGLTGDHKVDLYGINTIFYFSGKRYVQRVVF
jgi:hypothetical protein